MENGLTKEHSKMMQGISILLMLYHHLFGVIVDGYIKMINVIIPIGIDFEVNIAHFGKICVAIYAIISGYGLYVSHKKYYVEKNLICKVKNSYKKIIKSLGAFYKIYWSVFLIMIPLGLIIRKLDFNINYIITDFIGLTYKYNSSWWYVHQYVVMLILFPVLVILIDNVFDKIIKNRFLTCITICIIVMLFVYPKTRETIIYIININSISYLIIFIVGILIAKYNIFSVAKYIMNKLHMDNKIGYIVLFAIVISIRVAITHDQMDHQLDAVIAPIFILCSINIIQGRLRSIFMYFGKYSMYMWLIHCFICLFYWKNFILSLKFSLVMYVATVGLSLVFSI